MKKILLYSFILSFTFNSTNLCAGPLEDLQTYANNINSLRKNSPTSKDLIISNIMAGEELLSNGIMNPQNNSIFMNNSEIDSVRHFIFTVTAAKFGLGYDVSKQQLRINISHIPDDQLTPQSSHYFATLALLYFAASEIHMDSASALNNHEYHVQKFSNVNQTLFNRVEIDKTLILPLITNIKKTLSNLISGYNKESLSTIFGSDMGETYRNVVMGFNDTVFPSLLAQDYYINRDINGQGQSSLGQRTTNQYGDIVYSNIFHPNGFSIWLSPESTQFLNVQNLSIQKAYNGGGCYVTFDDYQKLRNIPVMSYNNSIPPAFNDIGSSSSSMNYNSGHQPSLSNYSMNYTNPYSNYNNGNSVPPAFTFSGPPPALTPPSPNMPVSYPVNYTNPYLNYNNRNFVPPAFTFSGPPPALIPLSPNMPLSSNNFNNSSINQSCSIPIGNGQYKSVYICPPLTGNHHDLNEKNHRVYVFNDSYAIGQHGHYFYGNNKINIKKKPTSEIYTLNTNANSKTSHPQGYVEKRDWRALSNQSIINNTPAPRYHQTTIDVTGLDTIDAGISLIHQGYNPVCLNMANDHTVGGGAVKGAAAQEENLMRRSANYYQALSDMKDSHKNGHVYIPEFGAIYTKKVAIIREGEDQGFSLKTKPEYLSFMASAAYNIKNSYIQNALNIPAHYLRSPDQATGYGILKSCTQYVEGTKNKIRAQLHTAYINGHDSIVLGGFGCGAFRNNWQLMAELYQEIITQEFNHCFQRITFAILNSQNPQPTVNPHNNTSSFFLKLQGMH